MRLAQVRIAAVSLMGGGVLVLGVLGSAQAAQVNPQARTSTDTQCQALPVSATASPSPSPLPKPSFRDMMTPSPAPSPTPPPSPSESDLSPPSHTASPSSSPTASASTGGPNAGPSPQSPVPPSPAGLPSLSGSSSLTGPPSPPDSVARASLDAYIAASPSSTSANGTSPSARSSQSETASPTASTDATAEPELCVSVHRSQASITRGHTATYTVRVSTRNTSASDVSVALTAQPTSQKATFTKGCTKGDGTAACMVSSVSVKQPAVLHAQIAVASAATDVK